MTTATKGARLTEDEQTLLTAVTAATGLHFRSEADALRVAALIGLRVLSVRALLTGAAIPLTPEQLAKELSVELLPVFELLLRHGTLPAVVRQAPVAQQEPSPFLPSPPAAMPPVAPPVPVVAPGATATLRAFGTSFLGDDDDDED